MRSRPTRLALAAVAALAVAGLGAPALTSPAAAGPGKAATAKPGKPTEVRFATFNASLNRGTAGQLVADLSTPGNAQARRRRGDDPARRRGRHPRQRVRLRRGRRGGRAVPRQLPRGGPERRRTGRLPLLLRRAVQHRDPERLRPQQQRRRRWRRRRVRLRPVPRPVRHGRLLEVPDRRRRRPDLPALPVEGHAGRAAARRPGHAAARPTGTPPRSSAVFRLSSKSHWDVPIKIAGSKTVHFLVSPPDAARLRRPRGPQRHAQPRRDPLLGRLRQRPAGRVVHLRRRGRDRRPGPRRRSSSSPATRTPTRSTGTRSTTRSSSCSTTRGSTDPHADRGRRRRGDAALQGGTNLTHRGPGPSTTPPTSPTTPRATCAPTTCCPASGWRSATPASSGRRPTDPLFARLTGVFPFPVTDHRLVWVDVSTGRAHGR